MNNKLKYQALIAFVVLIFLLIGWMYILPIIKTNQQNTILSNQLKLKPLLNKQSVNSASNIQIESAANIYWSQVFEGIEEIFEERQVDILKLTETENRIFNEQRVEGRSLWVKGNYADILSSIYQFEQADKIAPITAMKLFMPPKTRLNKNPSLEAELYFDYMNITDESN